MKLRRRRPLDIAAHGLNLGAEQYIKACLVLANWQRGADPIDTLKAYAWVCTNADEASHLLDRPLSNEAMAWWAERVGEDGELALPKVLEQSQLLRSRLDQFLSARRKSLIALRASANVAVSEIDVGTELEVADDGRLIHIHRYRPGEGDGVVGMLLAFLLDPYLPFGEAVRRCALESCGRYFLSLPGAKGGPKRRYCEPDHQLEADRLNAVERVRRRRIELSKHK